MVPDAGRHHTTGLSEWRHLAESDDGLLHEVDHELGESAVERGIPEGQPLGGGLPDINARVPLPSGIDERFGRVYGRDATGPDPLDQLTHEGARAAADIEHPQSRSDPGEVGKLRRQAARITAHEAVVGLCCDLEAHRITLE